MERLCTLNTCRRGRIWRQSQRKTHWITFRSFKVTHFGITEKPTRDCVLLYNNVGFRVRNFEGKVWAFPFSRTPLSFGALCLGNPCEYSNKAYISRNYNQWPIFCLWYYMSIFIHSFFPQECVSAVQGHPRSLIFVRIESAYATSY